MLTQEENELVTNTSPGTPGGELLRRYWHPIALSEELPEGGAPRPLKILGEDLVLFRDENGTVGLLGLLCSHRGADLSYGRIEDGGLRCLYHGWLYDVKGRCLEQPGEPEGSRFHEKIEHKAYPCAEVSGLVFAYLGPSDPPLIPMYEAFTVPEEFRAVTKTFAQCNYLQANEGNMDPVHLSFLHRYLDRAVVQQSRPSNQATVRGSDRSFGVFANTAPRIEEQEASFGLRINDWRLLDEEKGYFRQRNFIMPNAAAVPNGLRDDGHLLIWYVPIDNETHWRFTLAYSRETVLDKENANQTWRASIDDDFRPLRNKGNRYLQDREELQMKTFTGMGANFNTHDQFATETPGAIYDRTQEHLGYTDKAIIRARRMLLDAIETVQQGNDPLGVVRDVEQNWFPDLVVASEVIPITDDWTNHWQQAFQHQQSRAATSYELARQRVLHPA